MDDPASALQTAENALRLAVRSVLGETWQASLDVEKLQHKQDEDRKRRDGAVVGDDLLSYVEFHQLTDIILNQWESFKPIFDDKKRTEVWFGALKDVRNAIAHSRQLIAYERSLIAGISGQIRNQVTLYRTSADPSNAHYAVIERVVDNFGVQGQLEYYFVLPRPRLEVGDGLTFSCHGSDGRGRDLEWTLTSPGHSTLATGDRVVRATGGTVDLTWDVRDTDVAESYDIRIYVRASGSKYTRHGDSMIDEAPPYDDRVLFLYSVNPPVDE